MRKECAADPRQSPEPTTYPQSGARPAAPSLPAGYTLVRTKITDAAYAPWLALDVWRSDEGWVALHGRRV